MLGLSIYTFIIPVFVLTTWSTTSKVSGSTGAWFSTNVFCEFCTSGDNRYGQLGLGDTANRGNQPDEMGDYLDSVLLGGDFTPIHLTAGFYFNCALSLEEAIKCWGQLSASGPQWSEKNRKLSHIFSMRSNDNYQLGDGTNENRGDSSNEMGNSLTVLDLGNAFTPIDIEAGYYHVCALSQSKNVKCWGQWILSALDVQMQLFFHFVLQFYR